MREEFVSKVSFSKPDKGREYKRETFIFVQFKETKEKHGQIIQSVVRKEKNSDDKVEDGQIFIWST